MQCLKYLVLASMLMQSRVDPFDSQEARPYRTDPEVGVGVGGCAAPRSAAPSPAPSPSTHTHTPCLGPPDRPSTHTHPALAPLTARPSTPKKHTHLKQVAAMTALVEAYQGGNIREFERILRTQHRAIMGDPFIANHMQDLLANIRTQVGGWVRVGGCAWVGGWAQWQGSNEGVRDAWQGSNEGVRDAWQGSNEGGRSEGGIERGREERGRERGSA